MRLEVNNLIGKDKDRAIYNKLDKLCKDNKTPVCPHCNKTISVSDAIDSEYIKTKRGTEIFIHTKCIYKYLK